MKKKGNFRKVVSGLLAGMTMLSTVLSPMTAYAAEIQPEEKPPLYEEVKDLLDEDEVVTAKDYEIETGSVFDVKSDYTGLEIKDDNKVKVTFEEAKNKQFKNSIGKLFPAKMIPVMIELSGIDPDKKVNEITKEERLKFVRLIKAFPLTLNGLRDFNEAIITKGGVKVSEVNPSTMESKLVPNVYFAGEVVDIDGMCGGYNLQWAWSSGYVAGRHAAE